jgi:hypothetical protein
MTDLMENFLNAVATHVSSQGERTLFSLGGRGYYENAASDLLAFFLRPDAEHGFRTLFLKAFFECMGIDALLCLNQGMVSVEREVPTKGGGRIDLQVLGKDWCLIIENKIRHAQINPFSDYEDHAKSLPGSKKFFAILSPDGETSVEKWKGVSYKTYCATVRRHLAGEFFDRPLSKWQVFAREFILHLENELYINTPSMTHDQVAFVEKHAQQFSKVQQLARQYRVYILEELKRRLEKDGPNQSFNTRDQGWAFGCTSPQWGKTDIVMFKGEEDADQKFKIRAYLWDLSDPQLLKAMHMFENMSYFPEGRYSCWTSRTGYDSSEEAISELCKLAQLVDDVVKGH